MSRTILNTIDEMIDDCLNYNHKIQSKHISLIVKGSKPVTKYHYNELIPISLLGVNYYTFHAEIKAVLDLIKTFNHTIPFNIYKNEFVKNIELTKLTNNAVFTNFKKKIGKYSIIIIRINRKGELVNSKPCIDCMRILKLLNIKYIYYSNDEGNIVKIKCKEAKTEHLSKAKKNINMILI